MILISRQLTALTIFLSITNVAIGGTMGAISPFYDALYIGGDIGISNLINATSTNNPLAAHHMSATGIVGGGLLGYDYTIIDRIKLGIEGFGNANGLNVSSIQSYAPAASYQVNARYNVGVRILPGYQFNGGAVGYAVLGYTNARFKITDNGNYGYIDQAFNKSGFQCGLGMKAPITQRLSIRGDALYGIYGNASNIGISNVAPYGPQTYFNHFSTLEADLTVIYKFN